jgi:sugar lactone lactonase YvrE
MDAAGTVTTLAERWQGKWFNKPNNIVCRSDGSIFFTDPELRLPPAQRELGFSGVFRIDPQGQVHLAINECEEGFKLSSARSSSWFSFTPNFANRAMVRSTISVDCETMIDLRWKRPNQCRCRQ